MIPRIAMANGFLALTRHIFALLALALVLFPAASGFTQNLPPQASRAEAEGLTQSLLAGNAAYQRAAPVERQQQLDELLDIAAERRELLLTLIEANPREVLRLALPEAMRAGMPAQVQELLERRLKAEGELEILYEDYEDPNQSRLLHFLETDAGKRLALHFAARPPKLLSGTRVRVHGVGIAGAMALEDGESSVLTLGGDSNSGSGTTTTALPNTFGEQRALVILVNFQDSPIQPYTQDYARQVVFETTSNFYLENSFQQTWLSGDVYGWYTIPLDSTTCNSSEIASYAQQAAAAAGANLSDYNRYVYAFPKNACGWWGLGSVGGNPSQAWINGNLELAVVGHEMGHNLGLYHANALECDTATLGSDCSTIEYGDTVDIMAKLSPAHFNAFSKDRLGWLGNNIQTVTSGSVYWLDPYQGPLGANPKMLKILKSVDPTTGKKTWYYVEYRQAIGFDSFLADNENVMSGVIIHTGSEESANSSLLLDMTPASAWSHYDWRDPALVAGLSFSDPESGVTITPTWTNGSNAEVSVSFGSLACGRAALALALSPSQSQWVSAGTEVTYTVSVTNQDNAACGAASFDLQANAPSGWTAAFATPTLVLDPGASASTTLKVTSQASETDGFYTIPAVATHGMDASLATSASVTQVIVSALEVSAASNKPSYFRKQWVVLTAEVGVNGSPAASADVTFSITDPNGSVVTQTATTGSNGSASASLRLKPKDPVGVYQVRVNASLNDIAGGADISFTVQ